MRHTGHAHVIALLMLSGLVACSTPPSNVPHGTASAIPIFLETTSPHEPPAVTLLVGSQRWQAALGSWGSSFPSESAGDEVIISQSCTLGIITPREPLRVRAPFTATLQAGSMLQEISYFTAIARGKRRIHESSIAWEELDHSQPTALPAQGPHSVRLNLPPGKYVLSFQLEWEHIGAQYGFLLEVRP